MRVMIVVFVCWLVALGGGASAAPDECTSAVIGVDGSATGSPVLWKNRDTGNLSNKVVFVDDRPYGFLALVDADTPSGRHTFAGLNEVGFAIMNTVAYNLPEPTTDELKDLEGIIMADALRTCRTVADFERHLQANLGGKLGAWTNFGVIDGDGQARLYEVHNHGFEVIEVSGTPRSCLVNTNFSRTGEPSTGAGYLRHERASRLFAELGEGPIDWREILHHFTRDVGHPLVDHPAWADMRRVPAIESVWISTRDCINRASTSAAVVIVGRRPGAAWPPATMWVIPGEPITAAAIPLWVEAGASPAPLWQGEDAPLWAESLRIKKIVRPFPEPDREKYLDLTPLENADGTGFLPSLLELERAIVDATRSFLQSNRSPDELRRFQEQQAERVLGALRGID
jgi:hypothetical protein